MVYSVGLLISVLFLLATLATGFLLPSNHHVLHWRCQTFYVGCLLVGDFLLAINQIYGAEIRGFKCFSMGKFLMRTMALNAFVSFVGFEMNSIQTAAGVFPNSLSKCQFIAQNYQLFNIHLAHQCDRVCSCLHMFFDSKFMTAKNSKKKNKKNTHICCVCSFRLLKRI